MMVVNVAMFIYNDGCGFSTMQHKSLTQEKFHEFDKTSIQSFNFSTYIIIIESSEWLVKALLIKIYSYLVTHNFSLLNFTMYGNKLHHWTPSYVSKELWHNTSSYTMEHFSSNGGQVGVCISRHSNKGLSFTVRIWVLKFVCVSMCASVMSLLSRDYFVMSLYTHINCSILTSWQFTI